MIFTANQRSTLSETLRCVSLVLICVSIGLSGCRSRSSTDGPVTATNAESGDAAIIHFIDATECLDGPHAYSNGAAAGRLSIVESLGGGVAILDFDRDGRLDICLPAGGRFEHDRLAGLPLVLLRQKRQDFVNVAQLAQVSAATHYTHGCAAADYDNDGFTDMLLTGFGRVALWRNLGDGTFVEVSAATGLDDSTWSSSAGWGDVNGDGALDVYIAHYVNWSFDNDPECVGPSGRRDVCPPRQFDGLNDVLFTATGDGTFHNGSGDAGLATAGKGLGVLLADFDHDGDLDIYVANDTTPNFYYLNEGEGRFAETGVVNGTAVDDQGNANGSMGLAVTDSDADGSPDLWVTNYEDEVFAVYHNVGVGGFVHASDRLGLRSLGQQFVGFGCVAGDYDLDGDEDVAIANGHVVHFPRNAPLKQQPLLLINERGQRLVRATDVGSYFEQGHVGRGLAQGDCNADGKLDLVIANNEEPAALLLNDTASPGRSLLLRLVDTQGNRDAIGARVVLHTDAVERLRHVTGGGSYLSTSDPTIHFGIPEAETLLGLDVHWADADADQVDHIDLTETSLSSLSTAVLRLTVIRSRRGSSRVVSVGSVADFE